MIVLKLKLNIILEVDHQYSFLVSVKSSLKKEKKKQHFGQVNKLIKNFGHLQPDIISIFFKVLLLILWIFYVEV